MFRQFRKNVKAIKNNGGTTPRHLVKVKHDPRVCECVCVLARAGAKPLCVTHTNVYVCYTHKRVCVCVWHQSAPLCVTQENVCVLHKRVCVLHKRVCVLHTQTCAWHTSVLRYVRACVCLYSCMCV